MYVLVMEVSVSTGTKVEATEGFDITPTTHCAE